MAREEMRFEHYVLWIEKISTILLTLIWVWCWKSYIRPDHSVQHLFLFKLLVNILWCPLFIATNTLHLFFWINNYLIGPTPTTAGHSHALTHKRRRLESFGFVIERIGMVLLRAPYSFDVRGKLFQFGFCAIPCLVLFPLANVLQLGQWLSDVNQQLSYLASVPNNSFSSGNTAEKFRYFCFMFFYIICGLNVDYICESSEDYICGSSKDYICGSSKDYICRSSKDYICRSSEDDIYESSFSFDDDDEKFKKTNIFTYPRAHQLDLSDEGDDLYHSIISGSTDLVDSHDSGELKKTNGSTGPRAHRFYLSDEGDDLYHSGIPDLVDSRDSGEVKITTTDPLPPHPLDLDDGRNNNLPDLVESMDKGETGESEDEGEIGESESEGSFVMLELNEDEEEVQDPSTVEPREEQTETILEGKLANNEEEENSDASVDAEQRGKKMEKLETEICDHKNEIQKMVSSVENSEASLGDLIVKLSTATSRAEFYRLQAQESKRNIHILEKEREDLIIKLATANASAGLYRTLLHDLDH